MEKPIEISIISPVYEAEGIITELVDQINQSTNTLNVEYEIILVEDNSNDGSWKKIEDSCNKNNRIKAIKLSRNFGQHYAITAGIEAATGNFIIVIDCDLQDNPKHIPELYLKAKEGFDIVFTKKTKRQHSFVKNITASFFSILFNNLTKGLSYKDTVGSYSILSRKTADAFLKVKDYHRHYLMILGWLGFPSTYIEVEHNPRHSGKSSYSFKKLLQHAINGIISQSTKVLNFSVLLGVSFFVLSVFAIIFLVVSYFTSGYKEGWASVIVLVTLSTGLILMFMGIIGLYIGKIFEQVKQRPLYIIEKKINL